MHLAFSAAGMWPVVREMMLLFNHRAGPWDQAGFLQQAKQALLDLQGFDDHNNIFFVHFYEGIAKEQGTFAEAGFGSEDHMKQTWQNMLRDSSWQRKGSKVKWSRWGSVFDIGEQYMSSWFTSLPIMLTLAWQKKWWKHASSCPIFDLPSEDSVLAGLVSLHAATSGGAKAPRTIKDSEKVQENLRSSHKNAFHLCCSIQANPITRRLFCMILRLGGITRYLMGRSIKRIEKGPASALQTYMSWALGTQVDTCKELLSSVKNSEILKHTGFEYEDVEDRAHISEAEVMTEDELASRFMVIVRELVAHRALTSMDYSDNLPHMFLLLLQPDQEGRNQTLKRLREVWTALEHLEHASSHSFMHAYARSLLWPGMTSVRSILVTLLEHGWQLAPEVERLVKLAYSTPLQTRIVEDAFNVIQDSVTVCKSRRLQKMNLLHTLFDSRLFSTYGCKQIPAQEQPEDIPEKLPSTLWTNDAAPFSVGGKKSLDALSKSDGWQTASPQVAAQIPLAMRALLRCSTTGKWPSLFTLWWSLLAQPGTVLAKDKGRCHYVLRTTQYAVLTWPCHPHKLKKAGSPDFVFYELDISAKAGLEVLVIDSMSLYKVALVKTRSPLYLLAKGWSSLECSGIWLEHQRLCSFIEAAALAGFKNMTVVQLKKLWQALPSSGEGKQKMPQTLGELVPALVRRCGPNLTDSEVQAAWEWRSGHELCPIVSILEEEGNEEHCRDLLEDQEVTAMKEKTQKKSAASTAKSQTRQFTPQLAEGAGGAASASSSVAKQVRQITIDWQNVTIEATRPFWPGEAGAAMTREFKFAKRWKAVYPTERPPRSFSMVYKDEAGEKRSIMACLQWLWQAHTHRSGQDCPWDLSSSS